MSEKYKTSFRVYSAWNYQKEVEDLNRASEQGWQLKKGGCFHSRFVKNPDIRYRYQLDYGKIDNMGRYIETFREQGWEYINSTFNGWHYFRKLYDPSLPEEDYEIFTDRESLKEMNTRWARIALAMGGVLGAFSLMFLVKLFRTPDLPTLIQLVVLLVESAILIRGGLIMRNPESSRNRRGDGALIAAFLAVVLLGLTASITLRELRPDFYTSQSASSVDVPVIDNRWADFKVRYPDNYYLDLDMEADAPMTFAIVNDKGETVFEKTESDFHGEDIRLRLPRGNYQFSMSCETGYDLKCSID
ncbi:MAG: DUF2812 domain-containing protein [Oscillospiraceae bacterium]|nr:DUF2812 domain-containing protein [Oscillospiraceae bacterium]